MVEEADVVEANLYEEDEWAVVLDVDIQMPGLSLELMVGPSKFIQLIIFNP